jgi:hypothetical protein
VKQYIFRLLFTPCALHFDKRGRSSEFFKRRRQTGSKKDEDWLAKERSKTWASFDKPKGEPDWTILTDALLDDLNDLNNRWLAEDGLKMFIEDEQTDYWSDVRKLMRRSEREDVISKIRWFQTESSNFDRLCIPILTPKFLDALSANIKARARAYEEVSDYYTFSFNIFLLPTPSNNI